MGKKGISRNFSKDDIPMNNRHLKSISTLLVMRENANPNHNDIAFHNKTIYYYKDNKHWLGYGEMGTVIYSW